MHIIVEFINEYGPTILYTVLMAIISFLGLRFKKIYESIMNDKTKREIVKVVCEAVNQLYGNLSGEEKLNKTIDNTIEIFRERGIKITDLELRMLIESTVGCFKRDGSEIK